MILHIIKKEEWETAKLSGVYKNSSLETGGFIHCSLEHQVCGVANKHYNGMEDLLLMYIDENKVSSEVIFEDLYALNEEYPHIYGELNLDAVIKVEDFPPDEKGMFHI